METFYCTERRQQRSLLDLTRDGADIRRDAGLHTRVCFKFLMPCFHQKVEKSNNVFTKISEK